MTIIDKLAECGIEPLMDQFLPLSHQELEKLEVELGPFPPVYRDIILKYGGAVFDREVYFTPIDSRFLKLSPSGTMTIDLIYGAGSVDDPWDPNSLEGNIRSLKGQMPDTMIPVARSGHDEVCLGLSGPDRDTVFYWDHEDEPTVGYHNTYIIAKSFEEFVFSLKPVSWAGDLL